MIFRIWQTKLAQELLLFLTKICIDTEDKIRLKILCDKFRKRNYL
jgi:DNA phosphorothioation-dependent restriction protein DptG